MNADDPKFTAYALGELDPAECAAIEDELRAQPELAAELEEMRRFTAQLRGELQVEEGAPLRPEQRETVLGHASRIVEKPRAWWRNPWLQSAAAACVVVGLSATIIVRMKVKTPQIARSSTMAAHTIKLAMVPAPEASPAPSEFTGPPANSLSLAVSQPASGPFVNFSGGTIASSFPELKSAPSVGGTGSLNVSNAQGADRGAVNVTGGLLSGSATSESKLRPQRGRPSASERFFAFNPGNRLGGANPAQWDKSLSQHSDSGSFLGRLGDSTADGYEYRATREESELQGNTEAYDSITDNAFLTVKDQPLSTFSIDVDTASYANVRRFLNANERPPKDAVRIEELVNYFHYDYPKPEGADPFSCALEAATCPWQTEHRLVRIGLKGREIKRESRPAANLVFLIDVSGSMQPENRLPLVKQCLRLLVDQLREDDTVAIAVYAGASGCVLEPTHDRNKMRVALDRLEAGGSTNGAAGIQLAYDLAQRSFKKGGTNRVILCTDGDFNVGITNQGELVSMIQDKAKTGVFLSVFGVGFGNLKDSTLEKLADKGNGNYGYIDTLAEGRKIFVEQMTGTLFTIAKDVKVQVEFNPAQVAAYRLIGYENRLLAKEDFNDDKKDAGEMGAGHTVTALYEVVPAGKSVPGSPGVDNLKYQNTTKAEAPVAGPEAGSKELLTVKLRYKEPEGDVSKKLEFPLTDGGATWEKSSRDFRWAASVASFGLLLRDSPNKGSANWSMTLELATEGKGEDRDGYRAEFVGLVEKAKGLSR